MTLPLIPERSTDTVTHLKRVSESINGILQFKHDDWRSRTAAEVAAGVYPANFSYPPGDVRRYGGVSGQDCTRAMQTAIDTASKLFIPENFTALVANTINVAAAGASIRGASRYTSIIKPVTGFSDASIIANTLQATGTSYGLTVSDLFFQLYTTVNIDVIGVDLASLNNCTVNRCRFEGLPDSFANLTATGVRYAAPLASASYSNCVHDCDFTYMEFGVLYASGGNHNIVIGGEFILCRIGIDAAPSSVTDSVYVSGPRFEGCDIGILEGSEQAVYLRCRFENNTTADISFTTNSVDCVILGGSTAVTPTSLLNRNNAAGLIVISHDLLGMYSSSNSTSRANQFIGPNVVAPVNNTGTTVNPTGISDVALYARAGRVVLDNQVDVTSRNAAGTGGVLLIRADGSDRVYLAPAGIDIRWGTPVVALGGGAAPTLGTIGGSGPATAAQNSWMRVIDSSGNPFWVPVWR